MRVAVLAFSVIFLLRCSDERVTKVGIQPYGNFDQKLVDTVLNTLKKAYGVKIYALKSENIPQETFINIKSPRYRADKIIAILKHQKSDTLDYIVGLTIEDISFTKREAGKIKEPKSKYEDWGIFGLGYRPGPSCVISTCRLNEKGRTVLIERLKKIAIHELGHNIGLDHCDSELCVMKDAAESIKTVDSIDSRLCNQCQHSLQ
jgi:archaemetzincin